MKITQNYRNKSMGANQNFSEVARKCKELGKIYILKNNKIAFTLECVDNIENKNS